MADSLSMNILCCLLLFWRVEISWFPPLPPSPYNQHKSAPHDPILWQRFRKIRKITPILFDIAMVLCIKVGSGNKTGKSLKKKDPVRFSRVPKIVENEGEMTEELTTRRRRAWLSAISRDYLTEDKLENERVCYRHFVSGQAAKRWDHFDFDWVPTLHLGHTKKLRQVDPQLDAGRAERRKRRQENIEQEISEKVKKFNEPL